MIPRNPMAQLPTHDVLNMPPYLGDQDLWQDDRALRDWVRAMGGAPHEEGLAGFGRAVGRFEVFEKADQANRNAPVLRAFDRYGMRVNQVEFHPAYHDLMDLAVRKEVPSFAWRHPGPGGQVAHVARTYMFSQPEGGVLCPMAMSYAVVPALAGTPSVAAEWMPRILSTEYDRRDIPAGEKAGAQIGMFMTEKQGGSDVRANSSTARAVGAATGIGADYAITGHKFFCSAPMCDAFMVLAYSEGGLSCFLVPRWRPDGSRNGFFIERIKDKLGNRSNASTEMEFRDAYGVMVGEEGRGVRTIIDMVQGNRVYCALSSAGLMRQALVQALHHTRHRSAFQKRLIDQPLMRNVLADLALEVEGALALGMRVAQAMDNAEARASEAALSRIGVAVAKYWNCKRAPYHVFEALECHGGPGYIEDSIMPRLYREAPVNSIWEGSGNVMCLDVLRAMARDAGTIPAVLAELATTRGADSRLDALVETLGAEIERSETREYRARAITEMMALALQASLLIRHAPGPVAEAFCAARLGSAFTGTFGALPTGLDIDAIIDRSLGDAA